MTEGLVQHPLASELARSAMPLRDQLHQHFLRHHYPPVPIRMDEVAMKAIAAINSGVPDLLISLPDKIIVRGTYETAATAQEIADALVLHAWQCACTSCSEGNPHWETEETNG